MLFSGRSPGSPKATGPGGDDFWTWRQAVYRFVSQLTPADVEAIAAQLYVDMLKGGYTAVGEFHYLHHGADGMPYDDPAEMSHRVAAAAEDSGIGLTLLPVLYAQGGFGGVPTESGQRRYVCNSDQFARIVDGAEERQEQVRDIVSASRRTRCGPLVRKRWIVRSRLLMRAVLSGLYIYTSRNKLAKSTNVLCGAALVRWNGFFRTATSMRDGVSFTRRI